MRRAQKDHSVAAHMHVWDKCGPGPPVQLYVGITKVHTPLSTLAWCARPGEQEAVQ